MPVEQLGDSGARYLSIVGGKLVQKVNDGTEGAIKREYTTSDDKKGTKWELHFKNLSGFITGLEFKESDFGENLAITIEQDGETDILNISKNSQYFSSFARKLPNVDLNKTITLNSYDFESNGKKIRGLDIRQEGEKMTDYYYDFEKKKALNGMPEVNKEELKEEGNDYWKGYFLGVDKFLKKEIKKIEFPDVDTGSKPVETVDSADEISVEDIPF